MYYFIGIKGTGMASLAVMLSDLGNEVIGSDLKKHFFTEDELIKRNIKILDFDPNNIKDGYTVIIGNAFLEDFEEVKAARNNKTCTCYRYHEFLGKFMDDYKTVTVSGSHGKTTTTTMLKTVFSRFKKTGYLIGDGEGYITNDTEYLCVEADEFRRHFLEYHPEYAIINNIEIDHVDYFKDEDDYFNAYQEFVKYVKGAVFYNGDDSWCKKLQFNTESFSYGFKKENDFVISNLEENERGSNFDLMYKGTTLWHYNLPFVGEHLILDAVGVISLATVLCFDSSTVEQVLSSYHGPKRRYVVENYNDSVLIDDYAHHPTEVKVTLKASKKRYPDKEIIAIFKPHRASRVKYFVDEFVDALSVADKVYLLDFSSIDDKQDGTEIGIDYLASKVKDATILSEDDDGAKMLAKHKNACFVFMSSKDIYNIAEMTKKYL